MTNPSNSVVQNLLPVQAYFDLQGNFQTFIGQNMPFYATTNPIQSGLTITNSTLDSSPIGSTSPSTGVFTNITATTGQVLTQPVGGTDIVNLLALQSYAAGISWKMPCQCATLANITLSGLQTIDGYTTLAGDRVLVKNQTSAANNGIYIAGTGSWVRSSDADTWNELICAISFIEYGSQAGGAWFCTAQNGGTIGTTPINWSQFTTSATYSAGTGLTLTGTVFSITNTSVSAGSYGSASTIPTYTVNAQGQLTAASNTSIAIAASQITSGTIASSLISGSYTGITGVGTLTAGTWNATPIANTYLANSSITINGNNVSLGGSTTVTADTPNSLTFNNSGSGGTSGSTFNGASALTVSYNTVGAPSTTGTGASGTWSIGITGNAGTVTNGVYTTGSYSNPLWITSILGSIVSGAVASATTSTNLSGGATGSLPYQTGSGATSFLSLGTTNYVLTAGASTPQYVAQSTLSVGNATTAGTATNVAGGAASQLLYQSASGTTAFVANGTAGQFLVSNGTSAPSWSTVSTAVTISDQTSSASTFYPLFYSATSGTTNTVDTSSTKLQYVPSTGTFSSSILSGGNVTATGSISSSATIGAFSYGTLASTSSDTNIFASFTNSVNSYNQIIIQNTNTGNTASTDYVVNNSNSTPTAYYGDYGMNGSGWTGTLGTNTFNAANVVYLTATSTDLAIGTTTSNYIRFVINNGADAMAINPSGALSFAGSYGTSGQILQSNGTGAAPTWTTFTGGATISDDTTTNATRYPLFAAATSGTLSTAYTSSTEYQYNPSTGTLSVEQIQASNGLILNNKTVSNSYTIPTGDNAISVGPITIASGKSVTVPSGSRWVIL